MLCVLRPISTGIGPLAEPVIVETMLSQLVTEGREVMADLVSSEKAFAVRRMMAGRFFLKAEEECLAACNGAPMMMVDHVYYENLTPEKVDRILDEHK